MGEHQPFRVPDGYFDQLADRLMQQLPDAEAEPQKPTLLVHMRPWLYAAACAVLLVGGATLFMRQADFDTASQQMAVVQDAAISADQSIDEAADYAMLDNQDIYACLMSD